MLKISNGLLALINEHLEAAYPDEGAGFLLGKDGEVKEILTLPNAREDGARHNRYLITAEEYMKAEVRADSLTLSLIGVFHSHPDCPNVPSEYDREWAQPYFSYLITRVDEGKAISHRSWRLTEDRSNYDEEEVFILESKQEN
ncbi:MAG: M67 family metallopeptidase [Chloroflexota bacterium]